MTWPLVAYASLQLRFVLLFLHSVICSTLHGEPTALQAPRWAEPAKFYAMWCLANHTRLSLLGAFSNAAIKTSKSSGEPSTIASALSIV